MRRCEKCGQEFPVWMRIDGKPRNLNSRRFCLECSPFGQHNRRNLTTRVSKEPQSEKNCPRCQQRKQIGLFYRTSGRCKQCVHELKRQRDAEMKQKAIAYKGGKCEHCGYQGHPAPFVFHHIGEKEMTWNMMRNSGWSRVRKELDKCQLLCANCHHIVHSKY